MPTLLPHDPPRDLHVTYIAGWQYEWVAKSRARRYSGSSPRAPATASTASSRSATQSGERNNWHWAAISATIVLLRASIADRDGDKSASVAAIWSANTSRT